MIPEWPLLVKMATASIAKVPRSAVAVSVRGVHPGRLTRYANTLKKISDARDSAVRLGPALNAGPVLSRSLNHMASSH